MWRPLIARLQFNVLALCYYTLRVFRARCSSSRHRWLALVTWTQVCCMVNVRRINYRATTASSTRTQREWDADRRWNDEVVKCEIPSVRVSVRVDVSAAVAAGSRTSQYRVVHRQNCATNNQAISISQTDASSSSSSSSSSCLHH